MIILNLIYLCFDLLHLVPVFIFDHLTSLFEQLNDLCIFERKSCDSDFYVLDRLIFKAKIRQLVKPCLHLILDPVAEGFNAGDVLDISIISLLLSPLFANLLIPSLEHGGVKVELYRVVARGYGF